MSADESYRLVYLDTVSSLPDPDLPSQCTKTMTILASYLHNQQWDYFSLALFPCFPVYHCFLREHSTEEESYFPLEPFESVTKSKVPYLKQWTDWVGRPRGILSALLTQQPSPCLPSHHLSNRNPLMHRSLHSGFDKTTFLVGGLAFGHKYINVAILKLLIILFFHLKNHPSNSLLSKILLLLLLFFNLA